MADLNKDQKRLLMAEQKKRTLEKNKKIIDEFQNDYFLNSLRKYNLFEDKIELYLCTTKNEKRKWTAFVHLTTSLPYRNSVGRQAKFFVKCNDAIIGMLHITSAMAQLKLRDEYIGWDFKEKWTQKGINTIYNIQTCVAVLSQELLTCKLLVYCAFSKECSKILENIYKDPVRGFEITSLYGKSSVYNRIPFLKYLGTTEGNSAVLIEDEVWKKLINEYYTYFPRTKTNRQAPVKFQIIDKLKNKYDSLGEKFPYEYQNVSFKRGVYYGEDFNKTLSEQIDEWRSRWLIPRAKRLK